VCLQRRIKSVCVIAAADTFIILCQTSFKMLCNEKEEIQTTDIIQGVPGGMCETSGECSLC